MPEIKKEIPIRWGKYINHDMQEQKVIFIGAEKAIFDEEGTRLDDKILTIKEGISDAFSEERDYVMDDYCIYLNQVYKFITDKPAGPWDGAAVVPVNLTAEIQAIREEIEQESKKIELSNDTIKFEVDSLRADDRMSLRAYSQGSPSDERHKYFALAANLSGLSFTERFRMPGSFGDTLYWKAVTNLDLASTMTYQQHVYLGWGSYGDGTYDLSESIIGKVINVLVGSFGRICQVWYTSAVNDVRTIVYPGGSVDITIISETKISIKGTNSDYKVRAIHGI